MEGEEARRRRRRPPPVGRQRQLQALDEHSCNGRHLQPASRAAHLSVSGRVGAAVRLHSRANPCRQARLVLVPVDGLWKHRTTQQRANTHSFNGRRCMPHAASHNAPSPRLWTLIAHSVDSASRQHGSKDACSPAGCRRCGPAAAGPHSSPWLLRLGPRLGKQPCSQPSQPQRPACRCSRTRRRRRLLVAGGSHYRSLRCRAEHL